MEWKQETDDFMKQTSLKNCRGDTCSTSKERFISSSLKSPRIISLASQPAVNVSHIEIRIKHKFILGSKIKEEIAEEI